jgi:hypothetical protein
MINFIKLIYNLFVDYYLFFISFSLFFLFFTFLIDGFKFSEYKYIKFLQILISVVLALIILLYIIKIFLDNIMILNQDRNDDKINITSNVILDKESARVLSQGIKTGASQIGIAGSVAGVAAATATVLKNSGLPPMQKVAGIALASAVGGAIHAGTTYLNRSLIESESKDKSDKPSSDTTESGSGDFDVPSILEGNLFSKIFYNDNSVEGLIYSIFALNVLSLFLILNLLLMFLFRRMSSKIANSEFNFIDRIVSKSNKNNKRIKSFLSKVFHASSNINFYYINFIIFVIVTSNIFSIYLLGSFIDNFYLFCKLYLSKV